MSTIRVMIVCALVVGSSAARAEDKATAQREFQAASQHYDLGEYGDALEGFKRAYRAYPEPTFLFNIGQCERQLGQKEKAVASYRMYLVKVPDASNAEQVRDMVGKLERSVEEDRAAKPAVPAAPPPAVTPAPAPTSASALTPVHVEAQQPERVPVYKKWWFWTAVGVVAVGAAVGVGVGVTESRGSTPSVMTSLGNVGPF